MTYEEALAQIAALAPREWRQGLDRMREFVRRAGLEDAIGGGAKSPRFIHVAGTNGKGSVTAYLQSLMIESGYWTGAFFSPYVYDPRERIQFNRRLIPRNVFAMLTELLMPVADDFTGSEFGGISEFEFKTALGFAFWRELECEMVALEVGLGGRLDATNVVAPHAGIIVSIGMDHMQILGDTHAKIAREKAGIIKPGIPVVVGAMSEEARAAIEDVAREQGAPLWRYGQEIQIESHATRHAFTVVTPAGRHEGLVPGLYGHKQDHNMALAVAAFDAAGATRTLKGVQEGVRKARIPGRFERHEVQDRTVVLDGAHNMDAGKVLARTLANFRSMRAHQGHPGRLIAVTGMVGGHDMEAYYREVAPTWDAVHVVPIDFHRAVPVDQVASVLGPMVPSVTAHATLQAGLDAALQEAQADDIVLVTGSFYLVGAAGTHLGVAPEDRDDPLPRPGSITP